MTTLQFNCTCLILWQLEHILSIGVDCGIKQWMHNSLQAVSSVGDRVRCCLVQDGLMFSSGAARASRGLVQIISIIERLFIECQSSEQHSLIPTISVSFSSAVTMSERWPASIPSQAFLRKTTHLCRREQWVSYFSLFVSCSIESETERFGLNFTQKSHSCCLSTHFWAGLNVG